MKRGEAGANQRQLRVGEEIRHALVEIMQRGHFRDPDLQDLNVTVTEVRIGPDLKNATAFVVPLGGSEVSAVVAGLNRASAYFRSQLARALRLRHVPTISFEADSSFDYAARMNQLFKQDAVARDVGEPQANRQDDDGA